MCHSEQNAAESKDLVIEENLSILRDPSTPFARPSLIPLRMT